MSLFPHIPIFAYSPKGCSDISLALSASQAGGCGLVDLEGLNTADIEHAVTTMAALLPPPQLWGVRVSNPVQLSRCLQFLQQNPSVSHIPVLVLSFVPEVNLQTALSDLAKLVLLEVLDLETAQANPWAHCFLVKGIEAGGRVGEKSTFIQIQEFSAAQLPFVVQGGFGFYNIAPAIMAGAKAVVLDSQLVLFPQCPLCDFAKAYLRSLDENCSWLMNETGQTKFRIIGKVTNDAFKTLKLMEENAAEETVLFKQLAVFLESQTYLAGADLNTAVIPLGQDIGFAAYAAARFGSLDAYFNAVADTIPKQIREARTHWPFFEGAPLAQDLRIRYPLTQGPMANMTEVPAFAKAVAEEGVLPVLALASLFPKPAEAAITLTQQALDGNVFAAGIIGLEANKARRDVHLQLIDQHKPPFVLVAAGTIDQARQVQNMGIPAILHTPALTFFKRALSRHIFCMILEGSDCGGHIGNLPSMVLWESVLEYLDSVPENPAEPIRILFAGGLATPMSAAMLAVMISQHLDKIRPGMQMATAYMYTREIVETGALHPVYQQELLSHHTTRTIGATVNARARVIPTPFIDTLLQHELDRLHSGMPMTERKHHYEQDNLGALRIAAKAERFNVRHTSEADLFYGIDYEDQVAHGCFMAGQAVSLCDRVTTIAELVARVTVQARDRLK